MKSSFFIWYNRNRRLLEKKKFNITTGNTKIFLLVLRNNKNKNTKHRYKYHRIYTGNRKWVFWNIFIYNFIDTYILIIFDVFYGQWCKNTLSLKSQLLLMSFIYTSVNLLEIGFTGALEARKSEVQSFLMNTFKNTRAIVEWSFYYWKRKNKNQVHKLWLEMHIIKFFLVLALASV